MAGLMDGVRILDLTWGSAGPMATMLPCDHGADVIRIEPAGGDPFRAPPYAVWNRGKRLVTLDLRSGAGQAELLRLCADADVLIESFSPGTMDRLGLSYPDLADRFPHLVYVSLSGYGYDSARRDEPGYESLIDAWLGQHYEQQGWRDGEPHYNLFPIASFGAATLATTGMLAALAARRRTGRGQWVETSLVDGVAAMKTMWWGESERLKARPMDGDPRPNLTVRHTMGLGALRCGDGRYIQVHSGQPGRFHRAMEYFGLADRITPSNPPFEKATPLTAADKAIIETELPRLIAGQPRNHWLKVFEELDVAALAIDPPGAVLDDPQTIHNRAFAVVEDPDLGPIKTTGNILSCPEAPPRPVRPAPSPSAAPHGGLDWQPRTAPFAAAPGEALRHPLDGLRVLDFGAFFAGPYAARMLSDLGSDVIKIEPLTGDAMRPTHGPLRGAMRGKRSIALDLKSPEGRAIAEDLIRSADVICHNMRPGVAERIGIGYAQAKALKPDIVYIDMPGWGATGPKAHLASFAPLPSGLCGLLMASAGQGNPPVQTVTNEDFFNGMSGTIATLMGLEYRNRTGQGVLIQSPLLNALLFATSYVIMSPDNQPVAMPELDAGQFGLAATDRLYRTADGWLCLAIMQPRDWAALTRTPGLENLATDPRFRTPAARRRNDAALAAVLAGWFAARPVAQALQVLCSHDVPAVEPRRLVVESFVRDAENERLGRVGTGHTPAYGAVREIARLIRLSDTPEADRWPAPAVGEHSREILRELGWDNERIERCIAGKVITQPEPAAQVA